METENILLGEKRPSVCLGEMSSLVEGAEGADVVMVLKVFHRFARAIKLEV